MNSKTKNINNMDSFKFRQILSGLAVRLYRKYILKHMREMYKIFAIVVYIAVLPLIIIEMMVKHQGNYASQIQSGFHLMLFVVALGVQEPLAKE